MGSVVAGGGLPEQFGRYSILGHLATGGMAEVYIARQSGLQGFEKIVVIKRVRGELENDEVATGSFLDEARLVATLEHPNVAHVHEIGFVNGSYFFVMEYVHGADLRALLERSLRKGRKIPLGEAVFIASQVCAGLHYAHEKVDLDGNPLNIIHRDVSPSNVLLSHDGAVKLCDFGIAKAQNRKAETQRGVLKGKYSYMSPEQCRCEPLDHRSDIFSLGIILFEMSTLTRVFKADNDFDLLRSIIDTPAPLPSSRVPDYPPALERIVMRALEKRPEDRYQTAQEMQLELESFALENKMPQSSVHIAKLMGTLFEKRTEAWSKAQRQGKGLEDYLMDTSTLRMSGEMPVFMPLGSDEGEPPGSHDMPTIDVTPSSVRERANQTPIPKARGSGEMVQSATGATARSSPVWLIGAMIAALAGGGVLLASRMLQSNSSKEATTALEGDAEKLATAFDAAARTAHMKADGLAATPILRAGVETDAATMKDIVTNEYVFTPAKGETIEIFQVHNKQTSSLVRLPASAAPSPPLKPGEVQVQIRKDDAVVLVSAPISGAKSAVAGEVVVAVPVDLATAKRALSTHAAAAKLVGFDAELALVEAHGSAGAPMRIALPSSSDWNVAAASLAASPRATEASTLGWLGPVGYGCFGAAVLFVIAYILSFKQAARDRARTNPVG